MFAGRGSAHGQPKLQARSSHGAPVCLLRGPLPLRLERKHAATPPPQTKKRQRLRGLSFSLLWLQLRNCRIGRWQRLPSRDRPGAIPRPRIIRDARKTPTQLDCGAQFAVSLEHVADRCGIGFRDHEHVGIMRAAVAADKSWTQHAPANAPFSSWYGYCLMLRVSHHHPDAG